MNRKYRMLPTLSSSPSLSEKRNVNEREFRFGLNLHLSVGSQRNRHSSSYVGCPERKKCRKLTGYFTRMMPYLFSPFSLFSFRRACCSDLNFSIFAEYFSFICLTFSAELDGEVSIVFVKIILIQTQEDKVKQLSALPYALLETDLP